MHEIIFYRYVNEKFTLNEKKKIDKFLSLIDTIYKNTPSFRILIKKAEVGLREKQRLYLKMQNIFLKLSQVPKKALLFSISKGIKNPILPNMNMSNMLGSARIKFDDNVLKMLSGFVFLLNVQAYSFLEFKKFNKMFTTNEYFKFTILVNNMANKVLNDVFKSNRDLINDKKNFYNEFLKQYYKIDVTYKKLQIYNINKANSIESKHTANRHPQGGCSTFI